MAATDSTGTPELELKRLQPVASAAVTATQLATALYAGSKAYVPERLQGTVAAAESRVSSLAAPYLPLVVDKGTSALAAVDAKLDGAIQTTWQSVEGQRAALVAAVEQQRAAQAANLEHFAAARQAYLKRVEESVAYVKEQGLQGSAKAAAEALLVKVEDARKVPTVVLGEISEAWAKFVHMPAVERLVAASRTQVESAFTRYMAAHDTVVADPRYGAAVAKGGELLASLQGSAAYRAASSRLAPLLQPYAETATKLASPYVQAVASHLAPVPVA